MAEQPVWRESTMLRRPFNVRYLDYPFGFRIVVKAETIKLKQPYKLRKGEQR